MRAKENKNESPQRAMFAADNYAGFQVSSMEIIEDTGLAEIVLFDARGRALGRPKRIGFVFSKGAGDAKT